MPRTALREKHCADCGRPFTARAYARWGLCCRWKYRGQKRRKFFWTPERDQVLRDRYDSRVRGRAAAIAGSLGFPTWAIKKRAAQVGLTHSRPGRDWTPAEEAFLLEHAGSRHVNWMSEKLGRTEASVVLKLKRMRISRRWREGYTMRELELCFGVDHHVITRWIREEKLIGRRRGTRRTGQGGRPGGHHTGPADPWVFHDEDLLRYIKEHPMEFRLDKVDQLWFMDLISAGGLVRRALEAAREGAA